MFTTQDDRRVTVDPLYGYIPLPERLSSSIDHPAVQRLRHISQTSTAAYVYPSLNVSRFSHSLGAMFLAMRAWEAIERNSSTDAKTRLEIAIRNDVRHISRASPTDEESPLAFSQNVSLGIGLAALLHDVGHPPFSHALEWILLHWADETFSGSDTTGKIRSSGLPLHEYVGKVMTERITNALDSTAIRTFVTHLADKDSKPAWATALRSIVDSEIDIDRIDYLLRDNWSAGTEYGSFDYERLITSVELHGYQDGSFKVGFGSRARSGAEQLLLQRMQTYRWVIFHPRIVATDHALARAVDCLMTLTQSEGSAAAMGSSGPRAVTVGEVFKALKPFLNYATGSAIEFADSVGLSIPEAPRLSADLAQTESELRASVHDGTVRDWVQRGITTARILLDGYQVQPADHEQLERLILFGTTSMHRAKSMLPIWKNHEEYEEIARSVVDDPRFIEAVLRSWSVLAEQFGNSDRLAALRDRDIAIVHRQDEVTARRSAIEIFNHFAGIVVDRAGVDLSRFLDESDDPLGATGFWEATFRDFKPLQRLGASSELFKGDKRISLQETSPLVQGLRWIDDQRPKLFVYYCYRDATHATGSRTSTDLRAAARGRFVERFTDFFSESYPLCQMEMLDNFDEG